MSIVEYSGGVNNTDNPLTGNWGVRPVITLKPGIEYKIGNGSKKNPYYIGEVYNINSNSNLYLFSICSFFLLEILFFLYFFIFISF